MIEKVISGGQIGADVAGLRAAKEFGIATGGWMTKGFRTLLGNRPQYAEEFGIQEHDNWRYPPRTAANVRDSDATIRFARNWDSPGERLTKKECDRQGKPHFDVTLTGNSPDVAPTDAAKWLKEKGVRTLNVAGNGMSEIEPVVEIFLTAVFSLLQEWN